MAEPDDSIDWLVKYAGSFEGLSNRSPGPYERFYKGVGALVMGSATYEFILDALTDGSEWPYKGKPAWVLTSRDLPEPDGEDVDVRIANAGLGVFATTSWPPPASATCGWSAAGT